MSHMLNKAACPCIRCGETIEPGRGFSIKVKGKGWGYEHSQCPVVGRAHDALDTMARALLDSITKGRSQ